MPKNIEAPHKPSRAKQKWCVKCGADITERGNQAKHCVNCIPAKYLRHLEQRKLHQKEQRAGLRPPPKSQIFNYKRKRPETYHSQQISEDGRAFLVYVGNALVHVPMVCQQCGRSHDQVHSWGPIYGQYDDHGTELYQVLLCRSCYDAECEKYEAQSVAS